MTVDQDDPPGPPVFPEPFEETFWKYVLVVGLFIVFVGLANLWHFRRRRHVRHHRRRRRRRRPRGEIPEPELDAGDEEAGPGGPLSFLSEFSPWLSLVAIGICIAALFLMWYAATLGLTSG